MTKKNRILFLVTTLLFLLGAAMTLLIFKMPNSKGRPYSLHIPKGATYEQLLDSLAHHNVLKNQLTFKITATCLKYKTIHPGKYIIKPGENNLSLVRLLRRGQHYPVKITLNNIRIKQQLLDKIGCKFLFDINDLDSLLCDETFLATYHLTPENAISAFLPDSYEFYFDITAKEFFEKMYSYYEQYWNEQRQARAQEIGLTPMEAITLAAIVEEENFMAEEKAIIAGLYMNRLKKGMKLQSDPTVKYAVGDFTLKRILYEHLEIDSPYNTYKYAGLPPAPIRIPEKSTIDSVLYYAHHNYLYMCAKEDFSGRHNFATTHAEHSRNAKKYHQALNARNIRK